ncbi:16S rRNA (guanine(527)-N(7))-methyltransferase RsmG [Thiocapsa bogorovii]|uniref:16S rRNA (guanine(527)-N(7))-methyltransferase RsmG n=1 Tax=Thiocapsa bogorovii TaxID=521689 RepID=UPI001E4931AF|nr:16S rRNA (guanine(527)-N(7))-methyltransferase RsmG [Thiocapsa bogorovii]UHD18836.1 16S rRNA (guanine(527)-N(7))-methyltransferase RsmG [Thiocapsa bogorovii]
MSTAPLAAREGASASDLSERLSTGAARLGVALDGAAHDRLLRLIALLGRWNRAYNLTAVRDPFEMVAKHLLDSLAVTPFLFGDSILDLGTGAGLPGLPLAIVEPQRRFWLLDSNQKKLRFVRQAVLELRLHNVEAVHARIETYRPGRNFSTIVSRAVAAADLLGAAHRDLLARPGRLLLMKGRDLDDVARLQDLSDGCLFVHPLRIPFLDVERHLIELRSD